VNGKDDEFGASFPSIPKCNSDEDACIKVPTHQPVTVEIAQYMNSFVDPLFQLFSCAKASVDELMSMAMGRRPVK
jgi:hypothetical protein